MKHTVTSQKQRNQLVEIAMIIPLWLVIATCLTFTLKKKKKKNHPYERQPSGAEQAAKVPSITGNSAPRMLLPLPRLK